MGSSLVAGFTPETWQADHWLAPADLVDQVTLKPGMVVAEIAAGKGFYTPALSRAVAPSGAVIDVEWWSWLLDELAKEANRCSHVAGVRVVSGRGACTGLPESCCDVVLLADIWHEFARPVAVLEEARRILKPNGRLAILNWSPVGISPPGPPVEHRVSLKHTLCTVELNSWSLLKSAEMLPHGYLLLFEVTDESVQS